MHVRLMSLAAVAIILVATPAVAEESLLDIYQRALQSDPRIREAEALYLAELEVRPQARAALLPGVTATGSRTRTDSEGSQRFFDPSTGLPAAPFQFEQEARTRQWQLELRQTVFRWDQWLTFRQTDKQLARAETDFEAAKQDLMLRVADGYFEVLAAQDTLSAAQATLEAIERQLEQSQTRFEVGLIAITDVQEAQAAFDRSVADEIAAQRALASAREILRELTGEYVTALSKPQDELPLVAPAPASESAWVDTALAQNLDLVATRIAAEIASDDIRIRRTGHYPTLDLVMSRSGSDTRADRSSIQGDVLPANSDQSSDSISLQVRVPLFSGGETSSRVREYVNTPPAARAAVARLKRPTP
ncbi:MAG: TolC family protein, partial [Gammaproteobacteria bacterium]|nr:TolC family protein [Gammaproteobacteria bacterium]